MRDVWYHGTHDETIEEFSNRRVTSLEDIGTWVTGTPESAGWRYGPNVYEVPQIVGNMLEAHTDNFDELFFSNENRFKSLFADEPVSRLSEFRRYKTVDKVRNGTWQMRSTYLSSFRAMLECAGYCGIIWKNSNIDRQGGEPHDVAVFFNKDAIAAVRRDNH